METKNVGDKFKESNISVDAEKDLPLASEFLEEEDEEGGKGALMEKRKMAKKVGLDPDLVEDFHKRIENELP